MKTMKAQPLKAQGLIAIALALVSIAVPTELRSQDVQPAAVTTSNCVPTPTGLVSWWRAEGNPNDSAGTNNGVIQDNLAFGSGEVGQAFLFNHTSSYITVPASPSLDVGSGPGLTIECWIMPDAYDASVSGAPIIEWDSATTDGAQLWTGQTLYANIKDTSGNAHIINVPVVFDTNHFQHVALTYDKSSGRAVLYYNGTIIGTNNFGSITPQTTYPVNIGRRTGQAIGNGATYGGLMDELSVYSRAVSSSEIAAIYSAGSAGKCAPTTPPTNCVAAPSGLIGWWPAEGNANDVVGGDAGALLNGAGFASGEVGRAFSFTGGADGGTNPCIQIPYSFGLISSNYSIEAWVDPVGQVN